LRLLQDQSLCDARIGGSVGATFLGDIYGFRRRTKVGIYKMKIRRCISYSQLLPPNMDSIITYQPPSASTSQIPLFRETRALQLHLEVLGIQALIAAYPNYGWSLRSRSKSRGTPAVPCCHLVCAIYRHDSPFCLFVASFLRKTGASRAQCI
jgi:hypothetical protein